MSVGIGNRTAPVERPPARIDPALRNIPGHLREIAGRALVAVTEIGRRRSYRSRGVPTGDVAAHLGVQPNTPERQSLNEALTWLRTSRLVRYELGDVLTWYPTATGREAVARLRPGDAGHGERALGEF